MTEPTARQENYSALASEYYDSGRHPTSANFRNGSKRLLVEWWRDFHVTGGCICEVGAGRSLLAEVIKGTNSGSNRLVLIDRSPGMLAHSVPLLNSSTYCVVGDACQLPLKSGSIIALVAILADPYNKYSFWCEVNRVLKRGGRAVITLPAFEWAADFRSEAETWVAEFASNRAKVLVPSIIHNIPDQTNLIRSAGLQIERVTQVTMADIEGPLSPSLLPSRGPAAPVVTGFFALKDMAGS